MEVFLVQIIRLPLEGTTNTRDIGGHLGSDNRLFKWKKVLRSDCLSRLTEKDKDYLVNKYKLEKVIDLRSPAEIENAHNVFEYDERVQYINISLADEIDPNKPMDISNMATNFFGDFYLNLIENKQGHIKEVLDEIINLKDDSSVLFHCTAGKDRTGVIAMLLMGFCVVSKQDITTNYMQSATNLKYNEHFNEGNRKMFEKYKDLVSEEILKSIASSDVEYIEFVYDKLIEKYSTFEKYFLHIGISEDEINKLVDNITVVLE